MLTLQLPSDIEEKLDALTKETGQSKSFYIIEALSFYLEELEDIHHGEKVLQRIIDGKERVYSIEEVERELGVED